MILSHEGLVGEGTHFLCRGYLPAYNPPLLLSPSITPSPSLTQDVSDPAVMVSFPLVSDAHSASLVAWTTTPWTLPSNLALCVNPAFLYVKVRRARQPATP